MQRAVKPIKLNTSLNDSPVNSSPLNSSPPNGSPRPRGGSPKTLSPKISPRGSPRTSPRQPSKTSPRDLKNIPHTPQITTIDIVKRITFDYVDPESQLGFSQLVPIADPSFAIANMCKGDEIVTPAQLKIRFSHPLENPVIVRFAGGPYTRNQLAKLICDQYAKIYAEENEKSAVKTNVLCPQLVNVFECDGPYKIWGYDLRYLMLFSITIQSICELHVRTE